MRERWFNVDAILNMNFFTRVQLLLRLFTYFFSVGISLFLIVDSGVPEKLYWQIQNKIFNFDFEEFV